MKTQLQQKLTQNTPYTLEELDWLLDHIGDPDPQIRDQLVYASFCHIFQEGLITPDLARQPWDNSRAEQPLMASINQTGQATLTRSFTALLYSLFLFVDGTEQSPYAGFLTDRSELFDLACHYLAQEKDATGYHPDYGWVHAIAHGADFLLAASCHPDFPEEKLPGVLTSLATCLTTHHLTFTAGEGSRLAEVIVQLQLQGRLTENLLMDWLKTLAIEADSDELFFRHLNTQAFLTALYCRLKKEGKLSPKLEQTLLSHPNLTDY